MPPRSSTTSLLPAAGLLPALLLLAQCQRPDPAPAPPAPTPLELLPPATQTGARTFGCLVNGQAWTPAGQVFAGPLFTAAYSCSELEISANRTLVVNGRNSYQIIYFFIKNIDKEGIYPLQDTSSFGLYKNRDTNCELTTSAAQPGRVTITRLDKMNRIVSGTFAFTVESPACGKVVVTDGRFDAPF